eukprot:5198-Chlamydomonas_euryale.AAC.1
MVDQRSLWPQPDVAPRLLATQRARCHVLCVVPGRGSASGLRARRVEKPLARLAIRGCSLSGLLPKSGFQVQARFREGARAHMDDALKDTLAVWRMTASQLHHLLGVAAGSATPRYTRRCTHVPFQPLQVDVVAAATEVTPAGPPTTVLPALREKGFGCSCTYTDSPSYQDGQGHGKKGSGFQRPHSPCVLQGHGKTGSGFRWPHSPCVLQRYHCLLYTSPSPRDAHES